MKLIEFLLNNWYIAVVLFFLASGFLNRLKGGSGNRPPKRSMPPFGGGGEAGPLQGWGRDKKPVITSAKPSNPNASTNEASSEQRYPEPSSSAASSARLSRSSELRDYTDSDYRGNSRTLHTNRSMRLDERPSNRAENQSSEAAEQLDARNLAQGILWAEIVGPPRAKKPFRK